MKSFVVLTEWYESIKCLEPKERLEVLEAMFKYHIGEEVSFENPYGKAVFQFFKHFFDQNMKTYEGVCERNRENGKKGGRPRAEANKNPKNPVGFSETQNNPENPNGFSENPKNLKSKSKSKSKSEEIREKKTTSSSCGELKNCVFYLPLNDGSEHGITSDDLREWSELYPAVDVPGEIRKMRGWLSANTKKTKRGIARFIQNWLSRSQDKAKAPIRPFCTTQAQFERRAAQDMSAALFNKTRGRSLFGDDNDCQQDVGPNGRGIRQEVHTPAIGNEDGGLFGDS